MKIAPIPAMPAFAPKKIFEKVLAFRWAGGNIAVISILMSYSLFYH
jgi:hypothetical protein